MVSSKFVAPALGAIIIAVCVFLVVLVSPAWDAQGQTPQFVNRECEGKPYHDTNIWVTPQNSGDPANLYNLIEWDDNPPDTRGIVRYRTDSLGSLDPNEVDIELKRRESGYWDTTYDGPIVTNEADLGARENEEYWYQLGWIGKGWENDNETIIGCTSIVHSDFGKEDIGTDHEMTQVKQHDPGANPPRPVDPPLRPDRNPDDSDYSDDPEPAARTWSGPHRGTFAHRTPTPLPTPEPVPTAVPAQADVPGGTGDSA